jgi:hypothetical protein
MLIHDRKRAGLTLLFLVALANDAGLLPQCLANRDEPKRPPADPQVQVDKKPVDAVERPAPGRMFIVGRVSDPDGKPVPNASVTAFARSKMKDGLIGRKRLSPIPIGHVQTDPSGRFRLDAPRITSATHDELGAVAIAPGLGAGWVAIDRIADQVDAEIALRPEQVIQGRLFDLQGQPARDVTVSVSAIRRIVKRAEGSTPKRSDGLSFWWTDANDFPGWPRPATTDAEGRFTLHGVGRRLEVSLAVTDPRFAMQMIELETDYLPGAKSLTFALQPARVLVGRITGAGTGEPVPDTLVRVTSGNRLGSSASTEFLTDAEGRFRGNSPTGDQVSVQALPPKGQPYLSASERFTWPKGAVEHPLDLALPQGVDVLVKVTEKGTGTPIANAAVRYFLDPREDRFDRFGTAPSRTGPDGSFRFTTAPRQVHLVIQAPGDDYVLQEIGDRMGFEHQPDGLRYFAHAHALIDPKPGATREVVDVALRRGVTIKGRVVGPDDRPVESAWIVKRATLGLSPGSLIRRLGFFHDTLYDGAFELHGMNLDGDLVFFLDPRRGLGATANLPVNPAAVGPSTIRLESCGLARARLVDPGGKPVAGYRDPCLIMLLLTPGAPFGPVRENRRAFFPDEAFLGRVDPSHSPENLVSDGQGRITFPALIPGATYRIIDRTTERNPSGPQLRKEFTVKPGEALDLGDIRIEKPLPQ